MPPAVARVRGDRLEKVALGRGRIARVKREQREIEASRNIAWLHGDGALIGAHGFAELLFCDQT